MTTPNQTNGAGAAAILSAGIGAFALSILAVAGDKSPAIKHLLVFYPPTGVLSGVSTVAVLIWLLAWIILARLWTQKTVGTSRIVAIALALLVLSLLLTFPPIVDLF